MESRAIPNEASGLPKPRAFPSHWLPTYTASIGVFGIAVALASLARLPADHMGVALFAGLGVLAELLSVELFTSSRSRVSLSSVVAMASIVVLGPFGGVLTHAASGLVTAVTTSLTARAPSGNRASPLRRTAFNMGMWVLAAAAAGQVYHLVGGAFGIGLRLSSLAPFILAVSTDAMVNILLLVGVIHLQTDRPLSEIWSQDIRWGVPINVVGGIAGGGLLALAYSRFGGLGVAAFFLPVLSTSYAQRLYVEGMRDYVSRLERVNHDLDEANVSLLETLGGIIDAYDAYTYGHSAQVAIYTGAIAEKMRIPRKERESAVRAALIHDVGKIGVPETIISKQAPLTVGERNTVKHHPVIGAEIAARMKGFQDLAPIVRHHHEQWDGRGYPDGLAGAEIPLCARILALADSVDAMCSDRPYRPTRTPREVREEVVRCAGTQFDPQVVKAFLALWEERGPGFLANSANVVDREAIVNGLGTGSSRVRRFLKRSAVVDKNG